MISSEQMNHMKFIHTFVIDLLEIKIFCLLFCMGVKLGR
jgi:hypothetical protein